jgi:hypothetical protein
MKKIVAGLLGLTFATAVYANCSTQTFVINGKVTVCTTCCYYGNCTTTCN